MTIEVGGVLFSGKDEDYLVILDIYNRAKELGFHRGAVEFTMDLDAINSNGCPLDFEKLLKFSVPDFIADVSCMVVLLDRTTGKLGEGFVPKCARPIS